MEKTNLTKVSASSSSERIPNQTKNVQSVNLVVDDDLNKRTAGLSAVQTRVLQSFLDENPKIENF